MSMDEPRRPDPDALLAATQRPGRGRLKVFLGMSPGVGKTFEMLRAARRRKAEGGDVVVGVVETHGRRERTVGIGADEIAQEPAEQEGHQQAQARQPDQQTALIAGKQHIV